MYTCGGCDMTWSALSVCHCSGCHQNFSGLTAFDKHRDGQHGGFRADTRYCRDPEEVGLVDSGRAYPCWGFPYDGEKWWDASN